jgi:hypothetical protein
MNNVNELIEALKKGKYIRPVKRKHMISTSAPLLVVKYKDGKEDRIQGDERYFYGGMDIEPTKEVESVRIVGYSSSKTYEVAYIYFNPQCNRCFAKLTNGTSTDYSPSLTDFIFFDYEVVTKEDIAREVLMNREPLEVTMDEVHAKFGRPVTIVDNKEEK